MNSLRVLALAIGLASGFAFATQGVEALRFAEMFVRPVGPAGLEPTPMLRALEGRQVEVAGYLVRREAASGPAILAPIPVLIGEEDEGLADDLPAAAIFIRLAPAFEGRGVTHRPGVVRVKGMLELGARRESDGRLSTVRLRLDEAASRALLDPPPPR